MIGLTFKIHTWTLYQTTCMPPVMNKAKGEYQNISMSRALLVRKNVMVLIHCLQEKLKMPFVFRLKKYLLILLFHIVIILLE